MSTNQNSNQKHKFFMDLALQQAKINLGNTNKNPSVGCVIVKKNSVISVGSTSFNGRPHAEHNAISDSKVSISNSELYVTLEPCSHYGKTPPCTKKIIKNKIKKVYFSIKDPDKRSYNKSIKKLKKSHIKVNIGINSKTVSDFYKSYILSKEKKLPYVTCKLAISKDFYTINKRKEWITNLYSRGRTHLMRSSNDVILTSSKTIKEDNPQLNCRINGLEKFSPTKIILDNHLKVSLNSNVIRNNHKKKTIIFYNKTNTNKIKMLNNNNVKTYKISLNKEGNLDLKNVLVKIHQLGFSRVLLECGAKLSMSFLSENLVNDLKVFISNKRLLKNGNGCIKNYFKTFIKHKKYKKEIVNLFDDKLISYKIK